MDDASALLALARERIGEGRPAAALEAIVAALRMRGGEAAVLQTLHRARIMHQTGSAPNGGADQLASLFAQCVLAESASAAVRGPDADQAEAMVQDVNHRPQGMTGSSNGVMQHYMEDCQENHREASQLEEDGERGQPGRVPILAEGGRLQVVRDAYADGSSFLCLRCGGILKAARKDEHMTLWCPGLQSMPDPG